MSTATKILIFRQKCCDLVYDAHNVTLYLKYIDAKSLRRTGIRVETEIKLLNFIDTQQQNDRLDLDSAYQQCTEKVRNCNIFLHLRKIPAQSPVQSRLAVIADC